jgi:uncharacterized protein (UPF0216 family)
MNEEIFLKQMGLLNRHLAVSKKDLKSLLLEDEPKITLKDGSTHFFNKDELRRVADLVSEDFHKSLRLPIFIELSTGKYGPGTAKVSGRVECLLISGVLGKDVEEDEMFLYRPELREVRKRLKTTTQHMFTISSK